MQASTTKVFVVSRHGAGHDNTEILMAFGNREEAEKFQRAIGNPRTLCLADEKPRPHQYMWSDRFRVAEVSLF